MDVVPAEGNSNLPVSNSSKEVSPAYSHPKPTSTTDNSTRKLTDFSETARIANKTSPDVRNDVIERAERLLSDPKWLSDDNLTILSSKLLEVEDFNS